jgi:hypothetical protein
LLIRRFPSRLVKTGKLTLALSIMFIGTMTTNTVPNVYAGGPRADYDERYEDVPGASECWIDGYDAGFAGKYDKDRADECKDIPGNQYDTSWNHGCKNGGYMSDECEDIKYNPEVMNHKSLKEENRRVCYDDGFEDGLNNPFDHERNNGCNDYGRAYYDGFVDGCTSVEGNTREICEKFTDV